MSSDQIAYLRDLANSYQSEGNFSAAIATWEQILSMDPGNVEAKQGITLAQMQSQGLSPGASQAQDADATMMFSTGDSPFGIPPAPPAGGGAFDADKTMVFGTPSFAPPAAPPRAPAPAAPAGGAFDADKTMVFGTPGFGAPAPPAAPAGGGFDAEKTMVFGAPGFGMPAAPAAPPTPAGGGFDAEKTMIFGAPPPAPPPAPLGFDAPPASFNPSLAPPPSAPWGAPPEAPSSDMTVMSPPAATDFSLPPPSPFLEPPKPAGGGSKPLQDFALPSAPPSFTPPPMPGGGPALPPPPSGGSSGFSFELPPPPAKGGGGMGLPDLPSVGFSSPPPTFTPAPPPPPVAPPSPKKAGGQFGEVDPGEIESLAVPTVAPAAGKAPDDAASAKEREERLRKEYEQQYGRTPVGGASTPVARPAAPARPAISKKTLGVLGIVLLVVLGGGWFGIKWYLGQQGSDFVPPPVEKDPNTGLSKEKAEAAISAKLLESDKAKRAGKLDDAERFINEARDIALKNNIPVPQRVTLAGDEVQKEKQFQDAFARAVRSFCVEDYPKANVALLDLERLRPDKKEAGEYIERIYWNLAVEKLQQKEPWEAVYYLTELVTRNPADGEGKKLLEYAQKFQPGDDLGDAYLDVVDPLSTRMAGCQ